MPRLGQTCHGFLSALQFSVFLVCSARGAEGLRAMTIALLLRTGAVSSRRYLCLSLQINVHVGSITFFCYCCIPLLHLRDLQTEPRWMIGRAFCMGPVRRKAVFYNVHEGAQAISYCPQLHDQTALDQVFVKFCFEDGHLLSILLRVMSCLSFCNKLRRGKARGRRKP